MNRLKFTYLFAIIGFIWNLTLNAQQKVDVYAMLDTAKIRIGEQARIDLFVSYNSNVGPVKIDWPQLSDTLRKEIEIVKLSPIDTTIPDKNKPNEIQLHQQIFITSFDSGFWAIAPFIFTVNNDKGNPLQTPALLLEVQTLPVDTAEASVKDIKAPFDESLSWRDYMEYIWWALGILAGAIVLFLIIKKLNQKKPQLIEKPKPSEPPHLSALRSLENIKAKKLWQEGKYKEYYTLITDTLRIYLEGRYGIHAMELTTDEIMKIMQSQVIDNDSKEKLHKVLVLSDYVKFAKMTPIEAENELAIAQAFDFVNGTKRETQTGQE